MAPSNCVKLPEIFRVNALDLYDEYSAGGVVVRWVEDSAYVLLILDPYGKWGLPKGHIENGESSREAAVREVMEETGLSRVALGPTLGTIDWSYFCTQISKNRNKCCEYFLMSSTEEKLKPQMSEGIQDCRWISVSEAVQVLSYDNVRVVIEIAMEFLELKNTNEIFEE